MKRNKETTNTLIKRTNQEALKEIEKKLNNFLERLILKSKENMIINGRKTIKKEDVESFKDSQQGFNWEI